MKVDFDYFYDWVFFLRLSSLAELWGLVTLFLKDPCVSNCGCLHLIKRKTWRHNLFTDAEWYPGVSYPFFISLVTILDIHSAPTKSLCKKKNTSATLSPLGSHTPSKTLFIRVETVPEVFNCHYLELVCHDLLLVTILDVQSRSIK